MHTTTAKSANRLRELREKRGEKRYDVAALVRRDVSVVQRYEAGDTGIPLDVLETLCKHYGVLAEHLLGWDRDGDDVGTTDEEEAA